ncbi:MAG: type II secretion system F family protein [Patescibacteria group bacterium]
MIFNYQAVDKEGKQQSGSIDAPNVNIAITSLQTRGLVIVDINAEDETGFLGQHFHLGHKVKNKDIVLVSRQIATMFEAKVSALATFRMLAAETDNPYFRHVLTEITDDIKSGVPISGALLKHPKVFSDFYVHMVQAGEESGKMSDNFTYLADYLERAFELTSKAKNALIYPLFVIVSFIVVMILMITLVIPKLSVILLETGQTLPIYTRIVIGVSDFFINYWAPLLIVLGILTFFFQRYLRTGGGRSSLARFKLTVPYVGRLYQKIYLSRMADNLSTMLSSGISMVRALEITSEVVGSEIYREILKEASETIKGGGQMSAIFYKYHEIPNIMIQMIKVGEESGKLSFVLSTLSRFYRREVEQEIRTLVDLIEPAMIVVLGLMVGVLLTSVLMPIYNLASGI